MILRRYIVTVSGWGEGTILAASRGKALAARAAQVMG